MKSPSGNLRTRTPLAAPPISLMYPGTKPTISVEANQWERDLGLGEVLSALTLDKRYATFVRETLLTLTTDTSVIAWRQAVLADFLNNPDLSERIETILPQLASLRQGNSLLGQRQRNLLLETSDRLAELDLYVTVVQEMQTALNAAALVSPALLHLRENLLTVLDDPNVKTLREELPALRAPLERMTSLTIGINLDSELKPISAVLMAINDQPISEQQSFLERLIGLAAVNGEESGIAPLHHVPKDREERTLNPLFQDLDRLMTRVAQPVARALNRYVRLNSDWLAGLEFELALFVAAARLPFACLPEIAPYEARITDIDDLLNPLLVLKRGDAPIASDAHLDDEGRIAILTGPNSGGKTTYVRAVGLAQVLFQSGLPIPARRARMSPVDHILTHFPALETEQGRLAEEAVRLRILFERATSHSLVLLNETFASTAPGEAFYLAQDVLGGLRAIGVRAIYATHLVELAERLAEIEAAVSGDSRIFSLIAAVRLTPEGEAERTFRIERGAPHGKSYAREIARRHGISLEQILAARR
jgi:DNA mismatch repair protein MutS